MECLKKAKDQNISFLPENLTINNLPISPPDTADTFAMFFMNTVDTIGVETSKLLYVVCYLRRKEEKIQTYGMCKILIISQ